MEQDPNKGTTRRRKKDRGGKIVNRAGSECRWSACVLAWSCDRNYFFDYRERE